MTSNITPIDGNRVPHQPRQPERGTDRMARLFSQTMQVAGDGAAVVGKKTISAGKTTAKFAGIIAAIGGILLAFFALLCKILIG